jgi:type III secretory pathway lipoprotein EscJ
MKNKKTFLWTALVLMAMIAGLCLTGCDDQPEEYLTQWLFQNDSTVNVSVRIVLDENNTVDNSWSPSQFSISPGKSQLVRNKKELNDIRFLFGPFDSVTRDQYVNGSFVIVFIDK